MLARNIEGERDPDLQSKASMANSDAGTSSGYARGGKYQVFLSFCGRDTRRGFTSVLHRDLRNNGIHAFIDNKELRVGKKIGGALLQAINDSQIYIPIFSRNYASSKWCLRELKRMVDNTPDDSEEKKILPIFYKVKPKDVNPENSSLYETAIEDHKRKFSDEVESWQEALKKVDKTKGWVLSECKDQAELLDSVVEAVLQALKIREKSLTEDVVGLDDQKDEVLEKLDVSCSDKARLLVIYGMGGIGKTTLARVVYNKLYSRFGKRCAFLDDIREMSKKEGLVSLQKKLLTEIGSSSAAESINDVDYGRKRIGEILGCRRKKRGEIPSDKKDDEKVFIVLDDVDGEEQVQNLIGQVRLDPNTRIIITTRNTGVYKIIEQRMAREMKEDAPQILDHEMEVMKLYPALQLFKRHAFREDSRAKDLDSLSIDIVNTTGCLPLALKVIGSLLFGKPKAKWENTLKQLMNVPHKDVQKTLMISYKDLNYRQREIFLDIACFFINEDMTNANYMWEACGLYPKSEIDVLNEMSLINIKDDKFWMHDQLRDLGREIICQESPTILGRRSRLWTREEVLDLVGTKLRKKKVEAIDLRGWSSHISIKNEQIERFENLRFLRLSNGTLHGDFTDCLPMLKWISWSSPRLDWSVANMHLKNLVVLEFFDNQFVDDSKMQELIEMATKLKSLALEGCDRVTKTPDLSKCLDLERLSFRDCKRLREIDNSIGQLKCLLDLNITHYGMVGLPELYSLEYRSILSGLPTSIGDLASLKKLDLSYTRMTSLPESIGKLKCLVELNITGCGLIERVPDEIGGLVNLEHFSLQSCYGVSELPTSIGDLASLRKLDLSDTGITSLPKSIGKLRCLSDLNIEYSGITELPSEIEGLVELQHLRMGNLVIKQLPDSIGKLTSLRTVNLSSPSWRRSNSNRWELPKAIGKLEKLEELDLNHRKELEGKIPDEIGHLSSLRVLDLHLTRICRIPGTINMLSHLSTLDLAKCHEITELPELPTNLVKLHVGSSLLQVVPNLSKLINLEALSLSDFSEDQDPLNLKHECDLRWIGRLSKLKKLSLYFLNFTSSAPELDHLSLLEDLILRGLDLQPLKQLPPPLLYLSLHDFSSTGSPLSNLKVLSELWLRCSRLQEIQLNGLLQLQHLYLVSCELRSLSIPSSLEMLSVYDCPNMFEIQFLGTSASLEALYITWCWSIGRIVLGSEVGSLEVPDQSESSSIESTNCLSGVLFLTNAFKKLDKLELSNCENLLEIQVIGTLLSLQGISIQSCDAMKKLSGISNLKNLHRLDISGCSKLQAVEGLNELEFLTRLHVDKCSLLGTWFDILNSKIPDECEIRVSGCCKSHDYLLELCYTFKKCKEWAKMKGDAIEPDTQLQPRFHPSATSRDHEISEEPPIDNVREGILPENQNQTRQHDSNPLSISPLLSTKLQLPFHPSASSQDHDVNEEPPIDDAREGTPPGNQNQTREQDLNPSSISPPLSMFQSTIKSPTEEEYIELDHNRFLQVLIDLERKIRRRSKTRTL